MSVLQCPNIDKVKEFIIPTKEWLVPIEKLMMKNNMNTRGKLYVANLMNEGRIIVKLTNNSSKNMQRKNINDNLYGFPNIIRTYCTFLCKDDLLLIEKNKQFCNNSKNGAIYTLELMKRHSKTLKTMKLNIQLFKIAFFQLIFAQFNIFSKYGYTHNDIHLGNIFIDKKKEKKQFVYKYFLPKYFIDEQKKNDKCEIETDMEFIIFDFDDIVIIDDKFIKESEDEVFNSVSLYRNIKATIVMLINILDDERIKNKFNKIYEKYYLNLDEKIFEENIKLKNNYGEKKYRKKSVEQVEKFVYDYYIQIKNVF